MRGSILKGNSGLISKNFMYSKRSSQFKRSTTNDGKYQNCNKL